MSDLNCPYCDAEIEICHDDGFGYDEGAAHEMECPHCEKRFVFHTSISYDYSPHKADCLNGAEHKWKPTITFPKIATRMRCADCDAERKPTEEEMKEIMSDSKEVKG